jgi:hypothetical protein
MCEYIRATELGYQFCSVVIDIPRIFSKDMRDPTNKDKWATQHDALKMLDPPYVYHVVSPILAYCT